jgi:hypothetical protein
MHFSDEDLIAYLLGDASEKLTLEINESLSRDSELVDRLGNFRMLLGQIDSLGCTYEPPAYLVETTLARIDSLDDPNSSLCDAASHVVGHGEHGLQPASRSWVQVAQIAPRRRSSLWDSTALTACLTVMCCLALPALVRVRFESRKAQCAFNLQSTGADLMQFALNHPEGRFPHVSLEGPEAFAGVYAVRLREAGVAISPEQLSCASLSGYKELSPALLLESIPSLPQLHQLALDELHLWQRAIGGDFAYSLGVEEQGTVRAPRYEGRSHFVILADAPIIIGSQEQFVAHEGRGINLLYEDGRVQFVTTHSLPGMTSPTTVSAVTAGSQRAHLPDNPFCNQRGVHEVGLHPHDASLAPSQFPPLNR